TRSPSADYPVTRAKVERAKGTGTTKPIGTGFSFSLCALLVRGQKYSPSFVAFSTLGVGSSRTEFCPFESGRVLQQAKTKRDPFDSVPRPSRKSGTGDKSARDFAQDDGERKEANSGSLVVRQLSPRTLSGPISGLRWSSSDSRNRR